MVMPILEFFIDGFSSPICHESKTVSNLSVACSSAELHSMHARFWLLCLRACTYWNFLLLEFHLLSATIKTVSNLSVAYSSAELGFGFCTCVHAYVGIFYCCNFISYLQQFQNLSLAYSSAELQSMHTRFWLLCLHAFTYWYFLLMDFHFLSAMIPKLYQTCV